MILAGKDYGSGSSRDWAAKGPFLLGVKAVLAESYERIHRSNLVRNLESVVCIVHDYLEAFKNHVDNMGWVGGLKFGIFVHEFVHKGRWVVKKSEIMPKWFLNNS